MAQREYFLPEETDMNLQNSCPARIASKTMTHKSMTAMSASAQVVYIVNGDLHMRGALHEHLSSEGFNVVAFVSAAEYRTADKPDVPSCLVLDVDLPEMSGFELQRQAAKTDSPIVFVTKWRDVPSWVRAIKADAVDFLTSPLHRGELLDAVHIAIAMHSEVRSQRAEMAQLRQRFAKLTPREREVLGLVNSGLLNKQSALELDISETTLQIHRRHVMQKMAARSLADLVRMATKLEVPVHSWPARRIAVLAKRPDDPTIPTRRDLSAACP
jgi:FixJ family two-component response regulator